MLRVHLNTTGCSELALSDKNVLKVSFEVYYESVEMSLHNLVRSFGK